MLAISSSLLLAGCATNRTPVADPAFAADVVPLPENFALAPDVTGQDRSIIADLILADDPAFAALEAMALDNAPTLSAALARIDEARAQAASASANRRPNIGIDSSVAGTRQNPSSFGGSLPAGIAIDRYRTQFGGNISASWDVDIFGQLRASERAAVIRVDAASADAAAVRLSLRATIAVNITDWRTVVAQEETLRDDVTSAQELFRLTSSRARAGIAPGFDAVQAETLLVQARAQLAPLAAERARIIGALVTLTARPASEVMAALQDVRAATGPILATATTPADMLRARPDIAAAEARLSAANADIAAAARQRFPKLTLSGALGLLAFALGDVFSGDTLVGSVGAGIAAPLLDFGRIDSEIDASKARAKQAFANYRTTVFTAIGDAETAYGQVAAAREEVTALQQQLALEKDTVYLASIRYRRGLADFRTVLNAQRQLNGVNINANAALGRYDRARVALWLALGGS
ncbi:MAG: efflux transporter outer membrane subunit [Parasphingorhabdus sp.]|nr:efflux transporter outer membrane subunit [Parasphingorhabdus sp.]